MQIYAHYVPSTEKLEPQGIAGAERFSFFRTASKLPIIPPIKFTEAKNVLDPGRSRLRPDHNGLSVHGLTLQMRKVRPRGEA